jgi:hypothetical protein
MIKYTDFGNKIVVMVKGRPYTIFSDSSNYAEAKEYIRSDNEQALFDLLDIKNSINRRFNGKVEVIGSTVYYVTKDGTKEALPTNLNKVVIRMWQQKENNITPLIKFYEHLKANPSKKCQDRLFDFITKYEIVIDENGNLILYKVVEKTSETNTYLDLYSHSIRQRIGETIKVERGKVDDDDANTCSQGLHVAAWTYLPHYGGTDTNKNAIVIVKVNPANVVAIPRDYNAAKLRVCAYTLLNEYHIDYGELPDVIYRIEQENKETSMNQEDRDDDDYDTDYDDEDVLNDPFQDDVEDYELKGK